MQVKEILSDCLKKLNSDDFLDNAEYTEAQTALKNRLMNCLNLIYQEVAADYFPMTATETVTLDGGVFLFTELSNRFYRAVSLKTNGKNICFDIYPNGIATDYTGTAEFVYNYIPNTLTAESAIDDFRLTCGLLSDGVLGEYYFLDSVFDLASAYDAKFRRNLSWTSTKGREMKIKERKWDL